MHIPDGFLDTKTWVSFEAISRSSFNEITNYDS